MPRKSASNKRRRTARAGYSHARKLRSVKRKTSRRASRARESASENVSGDERTPDVSAAAAKAETDDKTPSWLTVLREDVGSVLVDAVLKTQYAFAGMFIFLMLVVLAYSYGMVPRPVTTFIVQKGIEFYDARSGGELSKNRFRPVPIDLAYTIKVLFGSEPEAPNNREIQASALALFVVGTPFENGYTSANDEGYRKRLDEVKEQLIRQYSLSP
jgi:hypothetical protein